MTREEMEELNGLAASMGLYDDRNPCKRAVILGKAIKELEQEPRKGTAYIQAIYTDALEEGIRCAMCTNTIKSDTGCDGGCIVDTKMYNKVMTEINSRLLRKIPREGHWIDIKNKNGTVIAARCSRCGNSPKHAIKSDFCPNCGADMKEVSE